MAQPQPQPLQRPYLAHPAPTGRSTAQKQTPLPQHGGPLKSMQSLFNGTIIQTGRLFRSANIRRDRHDPSINLRAAIMADAEALQQQMTSTIPQFHQALDEMEAEIVRARAVIMRDLREVRKKNAEKNMTAQERKEIDMKEQEKSVEKEVEREIEQAADTMADVVGVVARASEERKEEQASEQADINMGMGHDDAGDEQQTDIGSVQTGTDLRGGATSVTASSNAMQEMKGNSQTMAGNMQQQQSTQFQNTSTPARPPSQSPAIPPPLTQTQQMHLLQQRQAAMAQQQHQQQQQQQQQRQSQPLPHTPMQQNRTMPEDNIAFSALPGSTTNSPGGPKPSPAAILPPASHHVATQQGGLNIPAESLPLLPEHMRTQMAQVQTQAMLDAKQGQGGTPGLNHPHIHSESLVGDSPQPGTTPPPNFPNPQAQHQQQNTSNPQQTQPNLASPFEPQVPNQTQTQQQQQPAAQISHEDNIDFDAMFAADESGNNDLNAADGDINFDDFFNDIVGDSTAQGDSNNAAAGGQVGALDGLNETGVADFDLASFGIDDGSGGVNADANAGGNDALGGMVGHGMGGMGDGTDMGGTSVGNANAGTGLGLGMLDGLEQYANQATDDDPMDGLDFPDLPPMDGGDVLELNNATTTTGAENANGNNLTAGGGFDMGSLPVSNEELDAAMNMSMDQGTSFDDLLDGMYNDDVGGMAGSGQGGEGNGDGGGNGETSEFDDAFFNMCG